MSLANVMARHMRGYKIAAVVQSFVHSGMLERLRVAPQTAVALQSQSGLTAGVVDAALAALVSLEIITRNGSEFALSHHVSIDDASTLQNLATFHLRGYRAFAQALLPNATHGNDETLRAGMAAVHVDHRLLIATLIDKARAPRVLDIGGGSGLCAAEVLAVNRLAEVYIVDPVFYGDGTLLEEGRVHHCTGLDDVPRGLSFTLVLCVNTLHVMRYVDAVATLRRARTLTESDGHLLVQEFVEDDREARDDVALFFVAQAIGGKPVDWRPAGLNDLVTEAGWVIVGRLQTPSDYLGLRSVLTRAQLF